MFVIDRDHRKPFYQQIIEMIEEAIINGQLPAGARLPSERALSERLMVNRSTVIRAFDELAARNIIIKRAGSGTFVNDQKWGLLTHPSLNWRHNSLDQLFQPRPSSVRPQQHSYDLRSGDLPIELYPPLQLPETDWQTLIHAELQDDSARLGIASLREAVQRYLYDRFRYKVPIEQILITSGAQQAISLIALGLLEPGDAIGIEQPSYFYALPIFQSVGLRIYGIPVDQQGICIDKLDELVHKHSLKMLFVNPNFQNPTGYVMSGQRKKQLVDFCHRKKLAIVEDDAYSQLKLHSTLDVSPIAQHDQHGNTIYIGSLSKYLGRSIRIGWMIAPAAVVNNLANIRHQLDSGLSALPQVMAENYLNHYADQHEQLLRTTLATRMQHCVAHLRSILPKHYRFDVPQGGFHLYLTRLDHHKAYEKPIVQDLADHQILATEGEFFGDARIKNSARISFVHATIAPSESH